MKPIDLQYTYKKKIGFTEQQRNSLEKLSFYGVNVNQFIRQAVKEKIQKEWVMIKENHKIDKNTPF